MPGRASRDARRSKMATFYTIYGYNGSNHIDVAICIWIDWKFSSEFNGVHLEVIRGHLRGQKRSFWGQKSEIWPNAHDMHIDRLEIFF